MKIIRFVTSVLPFLVIALVLVQFVVSNTLAGAGRNTQSIDETIETVRAENMLLRQELAKETSLSTVAVKAKELGFFPSTTAVTLVPADVAYNR